MCNFFLQPILRKIGLGLLIGSLVSQLAGWPTVMTARAAQSVLAAEQQAVNLLNADRRSQGLANLVIDIRLTVLGEQHAQDMIKRNFFDHINPEGQSPFDRMKKAGISYSYAGENIAINQSVPAAELAFMNSPGHRANILNPHFTRVGIGVAYDESDNIYIVQEFITPKNNQ